MKCMHCLIEFHPTGWSTNITSDTDGIWKIESYKCPSCSRVNLFLVGESYDLPNPEIVKYPIRPRGSNRLPCPLEVPSHIAEDYNEACIVLPDSLKASAALSRRCLQNLLLDAGDVSRGNLYNQIQEAIANGLPSYLVEALDIVREIGNFAAHPTKSQSTGEIVPVEPGEAEFNLDVLEMLFDHYYIKPRLMGERLGALNSKLIDAGKRPISKKKDG